MRVHFQTNLDEAKNDVFGLSGEWLTTPSKGDRFRLVFNREGSHYELEVCQVTFVRPVDERHEISALVELHLPSYWAGSIRDWIDWFKEHVGRR